MIVEGIQLVANRFSFSGGGNGGMYIACFTGCLLLFVLILSKIHAEIRPRATEKSVLCFDLQLIGNAKVSY